MLTRLQGEPLRALGITGALPKVDGTGLWKNLELLLLLTEDFARFSLLYLRGGCWEDRPLLEESWVNGARTPPR